MLHIVVDVLVAGRDEAPTGEGLTALQEQRVLGTASGPAPVPFCASEEDLAG
jgi:hypothetical protein